ncbi:hypothetical protein SOVF_208320 [Spinacia oleracea]|nr:hypothetical protein SOVF_208320 [Spinacia oleracea]
MKEERNILNSISSSLVRSKASTSPLICINFVSKKFPNKTFTPLVS